MQVVNSLRSAKQRHPDCQLVKRKGRLYVICQEQPPLQSGAGAKNAVNGNSPASGAVGRRR